MCSSRTTDFWKELLKDAGFPGRVSMETPRRSADAKGSSPASLPTAEMRPASPQRVGLNPTETVPPEDIGSKPLYADIHVPPAKTPGKRTSLVSR